jgi:serine/threonine protein kinase
LEFLHGGDLFNLTHRFELSPNEKRLILAEILIALSFVHSKGYIYRDLKPENILISENGSIKLADFGLATKQDYAKDMCGTLSYMPPEMVSGVSYTSSADYWSFGVLAFRLLFGNLPFEDKSNYNLQEKIRTGQPIYPREADPTEKDFVQSFLAKNRKQRATFESTKKHPFWGDLDFEKVERKEYQHQIVPCRVSEKPIQQICAENFQEKYHGKQAQGEEDIHLHSRLENFSFFAE